MANGITCCVLNEGQEKIYDVIFTQPLIVLCYKKCHHCVIFHSQGEVSWATVLKRDLNATLA
jgi:hypothetical protein